MATNREKLQEQRKQELEQTAPSLPKDDEREALLGIAVGKKGIGKTHETLKMIKRYVLGDEAEGIFPRRVLIVDINNEFTRFRDIALSEIKAWCDSGVVEVRRISIFKHPQDAALQVNNKDIFYSSSGKMSLNEVCNSLYFVLDVFYDGLLLVEDVTRYVSDSLPADLVGALCTQRHVGADVIIHFQMLGKAGHPKVIATANWIRYHKVTDEVKTHEKKFGSYTEPLMIIEKIVDIRYSEAVKNRKTGVLKTKKDFKIASSYHVYWDADDEKIKGEFSKIEFLYAVTQYLQQNSKRLITPKLKETDLFSGALKYENRQAIVKEMLIKYLDEYYGN